MKHVDLIAAGLAALGIGIFFVWYIARQRPAQTRWQNAEVVDVKRNEEGYIESLTIHRDVHSA